MPSPRRLPGLVPSSDDPGGRASMPASPPLRWSSTVPVRRVRTVLVAGSLGLLLLGALAHALWFRNHLTAHSVSVSPDGLFRCEVTERSSNSQSSAVVVIQRRAQTAEANPTYAVVLKHGISNDSARRAYYSINWQHAADASTTTAVEVFASFGETPPFRPERWTFRLIDGKWVASPSAPLATSTAATEQ